MNAGNGGAMESYDVVAVGGGPGGYAAALRAALGGLKAAVIEKSRPGGTCLNRGCIPTKALIAAGLTAYRAGRASSVGLADTPGVFSDEGAFRHARKTVETLAAGVEMLLKKRSVTLITGRAALKPGGAVEVKTDGAAISLAAKNVIIATGSAPLFPKGLEPDGKVVIGSDEILEHNAPVGSNVVIIGGGVIGAEFACHYAMTGRSVMVVEMLERLLPPAPAGVSAELTRAFRKMKIKVLTGRKVAEVKRGDGAVVTLDDGSTMRADTVICAVGRKPCLDGTEALQLKQNASRRIAVGGRGKVSEGLYAVGDAAGEEAMLAHAATHQGIAAVEDILGVELDAKPAPVASVVYTHPEAAWVGAVPGGEKEIRTAAFPFRALGRAHTVGETAGYAALHYFEDKRIAGGEIVGEGAGEMIGTIALAIRMGATLDDLAKIPFPHPTFSEAMMEAALAGIGLPLHAL